MSVSGTFIPLVVATPTVIRFTASKEKNDDYVITLKTFRNDLKITSVTFRESGREADWQSYIPLNYSLTMENSADSGNEADKPNGGQTATDPADAVKTGKKPSYIIYKLKISYTPGEKETRYGEIVIKTNIPEKPEFKISGVIEVKKG